MDSIKYAYEVCAKKFLRHKEQYDENHVYELRECKSAEYYPEAKGSALLSRFNWMSSFVTGLAPLYYENKMDKSDIIWANQFKKMYKSKVFEHELDTMHDLGFLYVPYSVAMYQQTGDEEHRITALRAADVLLKRFDIRAGFIDAWGRMDDDDRQGRAIIDCMMNLELLLWAWKETGHTIYRDVAVSHADKTLEWFVREDNTVCHSFDFDRKTGAVIKENNGCGYANGSWWARGTAWAVYGFALMARYTGDKKYFEAAVKIARQYIGQLKENTFVPVWDFRLLPSRPAAQNLIQGAAPEWDEEDPDNCDKNTDTSACAIMACALSELNRIEETRGFSDYIKGSLEKLCSEEYMNYDETMPGILSHQNGRMVYSTYGDYYFVKALQMYLSDN